MKLVRRCFYFLGVLILFSGCSADNEFVDSNDLADQQEVTILNFLAANNIEATKHDSGLFYTADSVNSSGTSAEGQIVHIYYTAQVMDGQIIEDHLPEDGAPKIMLTGGNAIIPTGLDIGLGLMKEGETFTFYVPSELAYSFFNFGNLIPSDAILIIQATVAQVQTLTERLAVESQIINDFIDDNDLNNLEMNPYDSVIRLNAGIWYKRLGYGAGTTNPTEQDTVRIQVITKQLDDKIIDNRQGFEIGLNDGDIVPGLIAGIYNMVEGERAMIIVPSNLAYLESAMVIPEYLKSDFVANGRIPAYAAVVDPFEVLIFEITLNNIY